MKKIGFLLLALLLAICFTSCAPKTKDSDQHLEIYCLDIGYGIEWVDALAKDFLSLDETKDKYSNGSYSVKANDMWGYAQTSAAQGPAVNTCDIMFSNELHKYFGTTWEGKPLWEDLTDIYEGKVAGEDIIFEDKVQSHVLSSNRDLESGKYYSFSWLDGLVSIIYNKTQMDALGLSVPLTTDQLVALCEQVKQLDGQNSDYPYTYTFQCSSVTGYWKYMFPLWWGQYEGVENYSNFYDGISENRVSSNIFKQKGRLEALSAMDQILDGNKHYLDPNSNIYEFMESQTNFYMGHGLLMVNGDWIENEMKIIAEGLKTQGFDYEFRFMRTPVISSIVDKTPSIVALATQRGVDADVVLAEVIEAIDNGENSFEGVTPADFTTIYNARSITGLVGQDNNAGIPSYASAKEMAKDFIRYLASDRAQNIYSANTCGGNMPFRYDVTKNVEAYNALSPLQKDRLDISMSTVISPMVLPSESSFKLVRVGGLKAVYSLRDYTYETYMHQSGSNRKTGEDLYHDDIAYWTAERWNMLVSTAGLI